MQSKLISAIAVLALGGCAAIPLPTESLEREQASVRGAEELGASTVPSAKLLLQLAKDETETAKRLAANGDERAVVVAARAEADAELALVLAREVQTHRDAMQASEDLKAVQARGTP
jgi:hypothetical protein